MLNVSEAPKRIATHGGASPKIFLDLAANLAELCCIVEFDMSCFGSHLDRELDSNLRRQMIFRIKKAKTLHSSIFWKRESEEGWNTSRTYRSRSFQNCRAISPGLFVNGMYGMTVVNEYEPMRRGRVVVVIVAGGGGRHQGYDSWKTANPTDCISLWLFREQPSPSIRCSSPSSATAAAAAARSGIRSWRVQKKTPRGKFSTPDKPAFELRSYSVLFRKLADS